MKEIELDDDKLPPAMGATRRRRDQERELNAIATALAHQVCTNWKASEEQIAQLFIKFAEEIKRQTIEP